MEAQAFPLTWPDTMPRTANKATSKFKTALSAALKNVRTSLQLFAVDSGKRVENLVISSNVTLGVERPSDIVEARRTEMRHGGLHIVRATFRGFTALPAPTKKKPWREVLGIAPGASVTAPEIEHFFRLAAKKAHPDVPGGSHDAMTELSAAKSQALKEVGA